MVTSEQVEMEKIAFDFFDLHLGSVDVRQQTVDMASLNLPSLDLFDLESPWSVEEVWEVIKSMPVDKAPGRTASL